MTLRPFHAIRAAALMALLSGTAVPAAQAQDDDESPPDRPRDDRGSFSIIVENDVFTGTDRHYTNGVHASWLSPEDELPGYGRWLARNLPFLARGGRKRIGYGIGQAMFTPGDTSRADLIEDDRPYAGWLYGEVAITSETEERLDSASLIVGVVGPSSGAEWTQRNWHKIINSDDPKGWENQLEDEPVVNLLVDRQWRHLWKFNTLGMDTDITPHVSGALGNAFTYAAAGATLRFGQNLQDDFGGPPRIRPAPPGSAHFTPWNGFGWYVFAGAEARAVARNIFLDGNTFADSHSVDKKPLVADLQAGVAMIFQRFRVAYTYVYRTREFDGQDDPDSFAAVTVTARF